MRTLLDLPSEFFYFIFLFKCLSVQSSDILSVDVQFKARALSLLMCSVFLQCSAEDQPNEQEEGCWQPGTVTTLSILSNIDSCASATGYFISHTF